MQSIIRFLSSVVLLTVLPAFAAPLFYAIGPDSTFSAPRGFYSITPAGAASWQYDLGDGSQGITGGLTFHPGTQLFYAIANDGSGSSSLVSFQPWGGGALTTISSLGTGFVSGLAYNPLDGYFYAISTDWLGQSSLSRISLAGLVTAVGSLGTGFYGGLTFRPSDGLLYGFAGDALGVQREFYSINPSTALASWLFELGDGSISFSGGVAFHPADGQFYVISSDQFGASSLQTFTLAGAGSLALISGIGSGFWNVGLVSAEPIPEPSSWLPVAACLMAGLLARVRRRA